MTDSTLSIFISAVDEATLVNDTLIGHRNFGNPLLEPRSHRNADGNRYEN
jgi:hypothetical protein